MTKTEFKKAAQEMGVQTRYSGTDKTQKKMFISGKNAKALKLKFRNEVAFTIEID